MTTITPFLTWTQKQNRLAWAEDLESDSFAQGRQAMKRVAPDGTTTYCCLGVAACRFDGQFKETHADLYAVYDPDLEEAFHAALPGRIRQLLGLADDEESHLIHMNDTLGASFHDIAQEIRRSVALNQAIGT